jgi:hypothetical protein
LTKLSKHSNQFISMQILLFLFLLLSARGLPVSEALNVALLVASQTSVGAIIWHNVTNRSKTSIIELLGAGFALGSALFTVIDQILIFFRVPINDHLVPALLTIIAFVLNQRRNHPTRITVFENPDYRNLIICSICVFAGFSELTHGSLIAIAVLITTYFFLTDPKSSAARKIVVSSLGLGIAVLAYFLSKPPVLYSSWFLRPLFTKSDDAVFSESIAYSISTFGPINYAASTGTGLRYHWFSLAWSGLVGRSASVTTFGMTLHVVPVITFLVMTMLLISIGKRIGLKHPYHFLAPIILFFSMSAPRSFYFYYVVNTSNVLTFVWVLLFILIFVMDAKKEIKVGTALLSFSLGVVLLSKIPYAIGPLAGFAVSSIFTSVKSRKLQKTTVLRFVTIILSITILFVIFLTPHSWENRSYILDWNLLNIGVGSRFRVLVAVILIIVLMSTRFPMFFTFRRGDPRDIVKVFISGAVATGLIRFAVSGSTSEEYFLNNALIFGSLGVAIALEELEPPNFRNRAWVLFGYVLSAGLLSYTSIKILNHPDFLNGRLRESNLQLLVPFCVSVFVCALVYAHRKSLLGVISFRLAAFFFTICLVCSNMGIFLSHTLLVPTYFPLGSVAADVDMTSLNWLRENSDQSDIIATNRYLCVESERCVFDESSFLVSAVAKRQVFIEGPRFVAGGRPYPIWINDRISLSQSFANAPSNKNFSDLRDFGVTWFYLDTRFLSQNTSADLIPWNHWASLEYHDSNIYILKLKN